MSWKGFDSYVEEASKIKHAGLLTLLHKYYEEEKPL